MTILNNDIIITTDNKIAKVLKVLPGNDLEVEYEIDNTEAVININNVSNVSERECVNQEKCDICSNVGTGHYRHYYTGVTDIVCNKCSDDLYNFIRHYDRKLKNIIAL